MSIQSSKRLASLMCLFAMLNFVSCGSDKETEDETQQEEAQGDQGSFEANLTPLNASVATATANALIGISGDLVSAQVVAQSTPPKIMHKQFIFSNGPCPTASNDRNRDGFIDYQEAVSASGAILVPLDNQIDNPQMGKFPVADSAGIYSYNETGSLSRILANIGATELNLIGKTVMILGVSKSIPLPVTVASNGFDSAQTSLPIACGVFARSSRPVPIPVPQPTPVPVPVPVCPVKTSFIQALTEEIVITGERCFGGELVGPFICKKGQFIVSFNELKSCRGRGPCDDFVPAIVNLIRAFNSFPPEQCTFNFDPVTPVSTEEFILLNNLQVRFFLNDEPLVIEK